MPDIVLMGQSDEFTMVPKAVLALTAAERFAIPELVDATLSHVECSQRNQRTFSKCALVSRYWSGIARRKRYRSLVYPINYPERDDYPDLNGPLKAIGWPRYRSLKMLLADFNQYPFVCTYIRHFELSVYEFPVPRGQAGDFYDDWTLCVDRQVPILGSEKAGIGSTTFIQVLSRLISLRSLIIPDILADWWSLSALTNPIVPTLDYLQIKQPALYEDISLARFGCFMRLFGNIRHLELKNFWIHEIEDRGSPPSVLDLPHLELAELSLDKNWCRWSGALLQAVSELPNHHTFTCLELHWVPPNNILAVRNILHAVMVAVCRSYRSDYGTLIINFLLIIYCAAVSVVIADSTRLQRSLASYYINTCNSLLVN